MTATTEPTLLEELHALEVTAHRLATERDHAKAEHADLLETNCALQQDLARARHEVHVRTVVEESLRDESSDRNATIRRLVVQLNEIATKCDDLERRADRAQQEPPPVRRSWWSARIGNRL